MITLNGQMLSQLFASGANTKEFEFRAAELKGMMRYMYRIAYQGNLAELKKNEAELFGGAVGSIENVDGHASPIKLVVMDNVVTDSSKKDVFPKKQFLLHANKGFFACPEADWRTIIKISQNKKVKQGNVDLDWYQDLLILTLMICGVGKRSRKGRGRIRFEEQKFDDLDKATKWICEKLNGLTDGKDTYSVKDKKIEVKNKNSDKRPTILEIRFGSKLKNLETVKDSITATNRYLEAIDYTCHEWKKDGNGQDKDKQVYNKKGRNKQEIDPIGMGSPRFASSLIIGFVHTEEGIYPIYTFVKAVCNENEYDCDFIKREKFIEIVEKKYKEGKHK